MGYNKNFLREYIVGEKLSIIENERKISKLFNKTPGNLTGYDCKECLNRGWFQRVDEKGYKFSEPCKCMKIRKSLKQIEKSGLAEILYDYNFDNYKVKNSWQNNGFTMAKKYSENLSGWFYIFGPPGTGKTHLCTAICGELLKNCFSTRYIIWRDFVPKATSSVLDTERYQELVEPLKEIKVLYIDDFLKTAKGKNPTDGEIKLAFEIINNRYYKKNLLTIISSELSIESLNKIDVALGSRIYQRTNGYYISLEKCGNFRLK